MSRPMKRRRVCGLPGHQRFGPLGAGPAQEGAVVLSLDEYEALRLIDYEGLNQEGCARQMEVARTTVQGIYQNARKKVAEALVEGKIILIQGGEYRLCEDMNEPCGSHCGGRQRGFRRRGQG